MTSFSSWKEGEPMGSFTHFARALRKYKIEQQNSHGEGECSGDEGDIYPRLDFNPATQLEHFKGFTTCRSEIIRTSVAYLLNLNHVSRVIIIRNNNVNLAKSGLLWSGNDIKKLLDLRRQHNYLSERHFCRKFCKQFQRSANAVKWKLVSLRKKNLG